jgi:hypothetical protein
VPRIPSSLLVATGLVGGFELARSSGRREVGGALFAVTGAAAAREWARGGGARRAVPLTALYVLAMGGSHPLAHRLGARRSVAAVTAAAAGAAYLAHDRRC